jgi:hypothetical protein
MPRAEMNVPHTLGREEALRRLKAKVEALRQTYGAQAKDLRLDWVENVLTFAFQAMGFKISGTVTVEESELRVQTELPLTALPFKGLVEKRVKDDLAQMLA